MSEKNTITAEKTNDTVASRPLAAALEAARAAANAAEVEWHSCGHAAEEPCEHRMRSDAADEVVAASSRELQDSHELRDFKLCEDGDWYETVVARSAEEALEEARGNVGSGIDVERSGTIWFDIRVRCGLTGEEAAEQVALDPEEPECGEDGDHDWQCPHAIVGGLKENPGVWGHGGGVIVHAVCMLCGCGRTTDTWAQNPETGEQGLRSVSYEPGKHRDEVAFRCDADLDFESAEHWYDSLGWHTHTDDEHGDAVQVVHPICPYDEVQTYKPKDAAEAEALAYAQAAASAAASIEDALQRAVAAYRRRDLDECVEALTEARRIEINYGDDPGTTGLASQLLGHRAYESWKRKRC